MKMDSDEEANWRRQVEQLIETNRLLMEQLRETAQVGHDSRLSPSRADLRVSQKYSGQGTPYFEDFQRELRAIFFTEGIEDNWDRMKILLRNLTGVALMNAMTMVDPRLNPGGSVITDADELLSFLRATFLGPRHDQETMVQWAKLQQGTRSVLEFTNEFQLLLSTMESQFTDMQIAGFYLGGLNLELKAKILASKPEPTFAEARQLAHLFSGSDSYVPHPTTMPTTMSTTPAYPTAPYAGMPYQAMPTSTGATPLDHPMGQLSINEATLANIVREEVTASVEQIARSLRQRQGGGRYRERRPMQCYRCGGFGHLSFDCPNNNRGRGGFSRSNLHRDRIRDSVARQSNTNSSSFYPGFDEKTPKIDPQPLVGTPCTITATYNNCPLDVLLDSGAGTSLVNASTLERFDIPRHEVKALSMAGAFDDEGPTSNNSAILTLTFDNGQSYTIACYVSPHLHHDIIIGNPDLQKHDLSALALKHKATISHVSTPSIFSDHSENNTKRGEETAPSHNAHEKIFTGTKPAKFSKTANEKNGKNKGKGKGKGEGEGKKQRTKEKKRERETKRKGLEEKGETKVSPEESTPESPFVCEVDQISESSLARLLRKKSIHYTVLQATCDSLLENSKISDEPCTSISSVTTATTDNLPPELAEEFKEIFKEPSKFSKKPIEHVIELQPHTKAHHARPYRLTPKETKELRLLIDDLLKKKFIDPSTSPFASPVLLVRKPDGTYRLVIDYRILNSHTVKENFPIPVIEDLLAKIGKAQWFSTLDLMSGYYQISVRKEDRPKTAFVTPFGKYQFNVMPFGLTNAPSTFCRYMSTVLGDLDFVAVYLDDILIFSKTREEHYNHVRTVLRKLQEAQLIVKRPKCHFFKNKVTFLGHILDGVGIRPRDVKIKAIMEFPEPSTKKQAMSFLGMVNFYRKFIDHCSAKAHPINEFISKENVNWGEAQHKAFIQLKEALANPPLLVRPHDDGLYRLTTDASKLGYGAVLEELDANGKVIGVVGYFSKSLLKSHHNYTASDLELQAIVSALSFFRYILHGRHFILRTDHSALLTLTSKKQPIGRIARQLDMLADYDFTIEHLPGTQNTTADALSRNFTNAVRISTVIDVQSDFHPETWWDDLLGDVYFAPIVKLLEPSVTLNVRDQIEKRLQKLKRCPNFLKRFSLEGNCLIYDKDVQLDGQKRICVPKTKTKEILKKVHDDELQGGHFGIYNTFLKAATISYWPRQFKDVSRYVKTCLTCQTTKQGQATSGLLLQEPPPVKRWEVIGIDFVLGLPVTPRGNDMILTVVDHLTKRAHFIPTSVTATSQDSLAMLFNHVFKLHGFPKKIVSDRDIRFTSRFYQEACKRLGITLGFSSSNHPQTNGTTERLNATLGSVLKRYCNENHLSWDLELPLIEFTYNATPHSTTQTSPFIADLGYEPNLPTITTGQRILAASDRAVDFVTKRKAILLRTRDLITEFQRDQEAAVNGQPRHRDEIYEVGEYVLLNRGAYFTGGRYWKIQPLYVGPFKIVRKINDNAFELDLPLMKKVNRTINKYWFKKLYVRDDQFPKQPPRTESEIIQRIDEINGLVGYSESEQVFYCTFTDVDPQLTTKVHKDIISRYMDPDRKEFTPFELHSASCSDGRDVR